MENEVTINWNDVLQKLVSTSGSYKLAYDIVRDLNNVNSGTITINNFTSDCTIFLGVPQSNHKWCYQNTGGYMAQPPSVILPNKEAVLVLNSKKPTGALLLTISSATQKKSTALNLAFYTSGSSVQLKCISGNAKEPDSYYSESDWYTFPAKDYSNCGGLCLAEFTPGYGGSGYQTFDLTFYDNIFKISTAGLGLDDLQEPKAGACPPPDTEIPDNEE